MSASELNNYFVKSNCDKAGKGVKKGHYYYKLYAEDFEQFKDVEINLLEIGVWKGTSVEAWLQYLPKATIYCIDTFERIQPEDVEVLKDPRVKYLKGDSNSPNLKGRMRKEWGDIQFDVIIDDGLHTPESNAKTFRNLDAMLKEGGTYYVEDAWPLHKMSFKELSHPWVANKPFVYSNVHMDKFISSISKYEYTEHDFRKQSGNPDSYIFKVVK